MELGLWAFISDIVIHVTKMIKIGVKKNKENTQILRGSAMCLHPRERRLKLFTISEIRLHRRIFIITLYMIKLKKYPYTLNMLYHEGEPPIYYPPLQHKKLCMKGKCLCLAPHGHLSIPSSFNMSHMPLEVKLEHVYRAESGC